MTEAHEQLARQAGQAAAQGRWVDAEQLWAELLSQAPGHPQALYSLAVHSFQRGDFGAARDLMIRAGEAAPADPRMPLTLSVILRQMADLAGEWDAIGAALAIDAYHLPSLLAKAEFQAREGLKKTAAVTYRDVLKIAPPEPHWPDDLRPQLQEAQVAVDSHAQALAARLDAAVGPILGGLEPHLAARWTEAASIMTGRSRPYTADCNQLHVPRLPAIPFFDRAMFSWVKDLEAQTNVIRAELLEVLARDEQDFTPYITYRPGEPVNQWAELNHSRRWSTFALWRGGEPVAENIARCPRTAAALEAVEMAQIGGLCPNAMFSALAPHTEIPPHHGETNARLVVHLPLIVPPGCSYRVGFEQRQWREGEVLIFDDTLEHTARNDSDERRLVLIFDVWNPLLTLAERDMVQAMTAAARDFARE